MNITVFTSNQPRHTFLINELSKISDHVYAIQECNTVFTGETKDLYDDSETMFRYFSQVRQAERYYFGYPSFLNDNVRSLSIKLEDLNKCSAEMLAPALNSDYYVVFGASFIKGWLIDFLVEHRAVNIHMGLSPYYRGMDCNFWAMYDGHPEMVGATIMLLGKGLDSGDMLYHALPDADEVDGFYLGMKAVRAAILSLVQKLKDDTIFDCVPISQDKGREIRYSKGKEFDDEIADDYMKNMIDGSEVREKLMNRDLAIYYNPVII